MVLTTPTNYLSSPEYSRSNAFTHAGNPPPGKQSKAIFSSRSPRKHPVQLQSRALESLKKHSLRKNKNQSASKGNFLTTCSRLPPGCTLLQNESCLPHYRHDGLVWRLTSTLNNSAILVGQASLPVRTCAGTEQHAMGKLFNLFQGQDTSHCKQGCGHHLSHHCHGEPAAGWRGHRLPPFTVMARRAAPWPSSFHNQITSTKMSFQPIRLRSG